MQKRHKSESRISQRCSNPTTSSHYQEEPFVYKHVRMLVSLVKVIGAERRHVPYTIVGEWIRGIRGGLQTLWTIGEVCLDPSECGLPQIHSPATVWDFYSTWVWVRPASMVSGFRHTSRQPIKSRECRQKWNKYWDPRPSPPRWPLEGCSFV